MKDKRKESMFYFITFAISLVLRMVRVSGRYEMRLYPDDIGMLGITAYLSGFNWSDTLAHTSYYGPAYYLIFTPVMKYVNDPCTIWLIIILANLTLQALTCMLSYHIAVRYLKFKAGLFITMIVILCSFVVDTYSSMSQEPALFFLTWLIALILLKMTKEKIGGVKLYLYPTALALVCSYAYLVHSRAIVFAAALLIPLMLIAYYDRKKIRCLFCFVIMLIFGIAVARLIQNEIVLVLWGQKEAGLNNVNISVESGTIKTMLTPAGLRVMVDMFICNLFTAAVRVFGLNIIAIILGGMLVIGIKVKKYAICITMNEKVIFIFSLICYLLGVLGVCVVWGKGVVPVYFTDEVNYSYKGFAYFRYSATFLGPAALVVLGECYQNSALRIKMKFAVLISEVLIAWYYIVFIVEKLGNSQYLNDAFIRYLDWQADGFDLVNYKISVLLLFTFSFIFFGGKKKQCKTKIAIFVMCILCSVIPDIDLKNGLLPKPQLKSAADGGYYLVKFLEEADWVPDAVCCPDDRLIRYYQYHLKEQPIKFGYPERGKKDILFTKNGERDPQIPDGFMELQLDSNEWVWVDNSELYKLITDYVNQKE